MADDKRRKRRRYKEYLRDRNPYKSPAARRRKCVNGFVAKVESFRVLRQSKGNNSEPSFAVQEDELLFKPSTCVGDHNTESAGPSLASLDDFLNYTYGHVKNVDYAGDCEKMHDQKLSGDDLSDFEFTDDAYERFAKDSDSYSDVFSECEDSESDTESTCSSQRCETEPDDKLYSGAPITSSSSAVLLLSFVFKHKLTREAFNDLLQIIEAHCPRPNSCKTTVKMLFEFVSKTKGDTVKHYFCSYCKAYYGKEVLNGNCNICGKTIQKGAEFFLEVPIANQIQKFFSGKVCLFVCFN